MLLPAYVPDAVSEPLVELDVEPRYYAITERLAPDLNDLVDRADSDTLAVVSVNYFGFPQPNLDELSKLCDERGWYHVDDNAHSAWSVSDGSLLGTMGDVGITCLWKTLPIPNGALLYVPSPSLRESFEPSALAGRQPRLDGNDLRYIGKSYLSSVRHASSLVRHSVDSVVQNVYGSAAPDPGRRYDAGKRRFSRLSAILCEETDPTEIVRRRRENFRTWLAMFDESDRCRPLFSHLPPGICPQTMPVYAPDPDAVSNRLRRLGVDGVHRWPRLHPAVAANPDYAVATRLAEHVLTVPVHQHVDPARIETIADGFVDRSVECP
ncbi:DegT/DnrJ/EryC1/StrS family aminotransferase [Halovivax gelatinilyticus]|uniref:DegT/DnrJ/EryC1/StrS family aminotransferase n=1 Tax=Halovivax gelatinilyticus TaxID=2961597 RepID=UPI0020CA6A74|nr:DegT/DnrJ/EryC1/StrS family aminotransferase [Halovivax gelatinilyticus]